MSTRLDAVPTVVSALRLGLVGTLALILFVGAWALAVRMRWVTPDSGTGLVLAGSGMAGFSLADTCAYYAASCTVSHGVHDAVPGADELRLVGWVAYGCGVGVALATCLLSRARRSHEGHPRGLHRANRHTMNRKQRIAIVVGAVVLLALVALRLTGPRVFTTGLGGGDVGHAETQMANFETCIVLYRETHGRLPPSLQVLAEPDPSTGEGYIDGIPNDPWGNPYVYEILSDTEYRILSCGEDTQEGTADDVVWPWPREE